MLRKRGERKGRKFRDMAPNTYAGRSERGAIDFGSLSNSKGAEEKERRSEKKVGMGAEEQQQEDVRL